MNKILLALLFSPLYSSVPNSFVPPLPDYDDFTPREREMIYRSQPNVKQPIILPTMTVTFDIIIDGDSILYDCPVFTLNGKEVICQVCGRPPCQIEVTNGKLKCYCFNHIPKRVRVALD